MLRIRDFIPDPTFFHPGSRIRIFSIPGPGSTPKTLSILTQKIVFLSSQKIFGLFCLLIVQMDWNFKSRSQTLKGRKSFRKRNHQQRKRTIL
jgi:hypothetical protein